MKFVQNNTPFSNKLFLAFIEKKKMPRKSKKQVKNYRLGKGLFKRNGIIIYDEAWDLPY